MATVKKEINDNGEFKEISSFKIFSSFIKYDENGGCNASAVLGKDCYSSWLRSRRCEPKNPHEAFRRAVTAHIRGNDGRRPFPEDAERSLLKELRKKKQWQAFEGTDLLVGIKGFSSLGHHEKRHLFQKPKRKANTYAGFKPTKKKGSLPLKRTKEFAYISQPLKFELGRIDEPKNDIQVYDFDSIVPSNQNQDHQIKDGLDYYNTSKACSKKCYCSGSFDEFDPLFDEVVELCDETLDGIEYRNVFESSFVNDFLMPNENAVC